MHRLPITIYNGQQFKNDIKITREKLRMLLVFITFIIMIATNTKTTNFLELYQYYYHKLNISLSGRSEGGSSYSCLL